jgi:hypothetical protein
VFSVTSSRRVSPLSEHALRLSPFGRQAAPYLPAPLKSSQKEILTGLLSNEKDGDLKQTKQSVQVYTAPSLREFLLPDLITTRAPPLTVLNVFSWLA